MDQLIRQNRKRIKRVVEGHAYRWHVPRQDYEDVLQETLLRVVQGWKPSIKDPQAYFLSSVYMNAHTTMARLKGFHNGKKRPQAVKAVGEQNTYAVGIYQPLDGGDDVLLDERILPTVPSAEDVYMQTVPSKRQTALRTAIDGLPERQRTALTHQFYEELSVADSASLMGTTTTEVYALRTNAMKSLKRKLNA